jgi:hypothetical protein
MWQVRPHVPEVRHKFARFSQVGTTEPRHPSVLMQVDVKDAGVVRQCKLQRSPHGRAVEEAPESRIVLVPVVLNFQIGVGKDEDTASGAAHLASDEPGPLCCEFVRTAEISNDVIHHFIGEFEVDVHWSAFRCWAKTSMGRPVAT